MHFANILAYACERVNRVKILYCSIKKVNQVSRDSSVAFLVHGLRSAFLLAPCRFNLRDFEHTGLGGSPEDSSIFTFFIQHRHQSDNSRQTYCLECLIWTALQPTI